MRNADLLQEVLKGHAIEAVIHFAGLKAVGESVSMPLKYYDNNVHGSVVLMEAMKQCHVKTLVFSSSATVYGDSCAPPWNEHVATLPTNPYGQSKLMVDQDHGRRSGFRRHLVNDVASLLQSCRRTP